VDLNSRKVLQLSRKTQFGRGLNKTGENTFSPTGAPSVKIVFKVSGDKAVSFSIHEPEPVVTAARI
jgi:hypothetical protein